MRFIHIADVHLGMHPDLRYEWSTERTKEIWKTFKAIITLCEEEKIDLLLIAGDLFHKQPLLRELKEVNYLFQRLTKTHVVLMAGNHDHISQTSNYIQFPWAQNVHMFYEDELTDYYIEELNTRIYGLSYLTRDITDPRYHVEVPIDRQEITILLAHGGDEKDIPMDRKVISSIGYTYVALGHIHKPMIYSDEMAYAGSIEPLDKTEIGEHGYIYGEVVSEAGTYQTNISFIPCSLRQYVPLTIDVEPHMTMLEISTRIQDQIQALGEQNIYMINLEGARDIELTIDVDELIALGNIVEIQDTTIPDYDFEELRIENQDNIIGMYIEKIRSLDYQDEVIDKALYLGVKALMKQKSR